MKNENLMSSHFYVVSLNIGCSGADCICYDKQYANSKRDEYLKECRLKQVEGEIVIYSIKVADYDEYTEQDYFDGNVEIIGEKVVEKIKISFA